MTSTLLSRTRSTHGQDAVEASSSSPAWTTARRVRRRAARRPRARILRSRPRPGGADAARWRRGRGAEGPRRVGARGGGRLGHTTQRAHHGHYARSGASSPHERELLEVYARYAAAVFDTATALNDTRRRQEQSRALLELRQRARVPGDERGGSRSARSTPVLVGCDSIDFPVGRVGRRPAVQGPDERGLRGRGAPARAVRPPSGGEREAGRGAALPDSDPIFLERDADDAFVARVMLLAGTVATLSTKIVTIERLLRRAHVNVADRPERLRRSRALCDALMGCRRADRNRPRQAWLLEEMAQQAREDNLTWLLEEMAQQAREDNLTAYSGSAHPTRRLPRRSKARRRTAHPRPARHRELQADQRRTWAPGG